METEFYDNMDQEIVFNADRSRLANPLSKVSTGPNTILGNIIGASLVVSGQYRVILTKLTHVKTQYMSAYLSFQLKAGEKS